MTYHSHVGINGGNPLVGARFQKLGGNDLLDGQDDAVLTPDTDRGAAALDSLDGVLDLEVAAIGGEDGVEQVVTCADRRLQSGRSALSGANIKRGTKDSGR